jgi:hypothetical protein
VTGPPGQLVVEASIDLASWFPIATNSFTGALTFTELQTGVSLNNYYRVQVR